MRRTREFLTFSTNPEKSYKYEMRLLLKAYPLRLMCQNFYIDETERKKQINYSFSCFNNFVCVFLTVLNKPNKKHLELILQTID